MMKYLTINFGILLIVVFITTCSDVSKKEVQKQKPSVQVPQIKCGPCNTLIAINGIDEEWKTNRTNVIGNKTSVGTCRDNEFLYVHLLTSDPELSMQIINFGLTLWFDPQCSQKKAIGVQFPVIHMQPPPPRDGNPPVGDELQKYLNMRLKDIIVEFTENKNVRQMSMEEAIKQGINAKIGVSPGLLCYELQYPLHMTNAYTMGLGLMNQKQIEICIETPVIDFNKIMEPIEKVSKPGEVQRLQDVATKGMKPKPPKLNRISQWIQVLF
jgi:hypothetical protein